MHVRVASSPGLPRLFITASDVKVGRPGRFWYVMITSDRRERHFLTTKRQAAHAFVPGACTRMIGKVAS